jgi:hypothetical protein
MQGLVNGETGQVKYESNLCFLVFTGDHFRLLSIFSDVGS